MISSFETTCIGLSFFFRERFKGFQCSVHKVQSIFAVSSINVPCYWLLKEIYWYFIQFFSGYELSNVCFILSATFEIPSFTILFYYLKYVSILIMLITCVIIIVFEFLGILSLIETSETLESPLAACLSVRLLQPFN